jgi:hypothetical protein
VPTHLLDVTRIKSGSGQFGTMGYTRVMGEVIRNKRGGKKCAVKNINKGKM